MLLDLKKNLRAFFFRYGAFSELKKPPFYLGGSRGLLVSDLVSEVYNLIILRELVHF